MNCTIHPGTVRGTINAPASKSYAQRAVFAAAMANGTSLLDGLDFSDDTLHALFNAVNIGAEIRYIGKSVNITGNPVPRVQSFYAGESGLTARILSALLMVFEGKQVLHGSGSLVQRPFDPIFKVYDQLGVDYQSKGNRLPLTIGQMTRQDMVTIDGSLSSQFITGLLIALPKTGYNGKLIIENPTSHAYIDMTIELLRVFGIDWKWINGNTLQLTDKSSYRPGQYSIEGDWSGAAFPIVAGITSGEVTINQLRLDSLQADQALLKLVKNYFEEVNGKIRFTIGRMEAFEFDATHCPDLFPPLAVLAANASGPCKIIGTHRLKHKESDRALILQEEFGKLWVRIDLEGDDMIVYPSKPAGGIVDAHNDHRIAMALSILALQAEDPITITSVECVSKSYPRFFDDLRSLGVRLEMD